MLIIDGVQTEEDLKAFANLEEVLKHIMKSKGMANRVITDVLVNDEAFSEIYPHQAEDISCEDISSVEIRSMPMAQMAVEMSTELNKVPHMMELGARQVATLFRDASDTDALELFQDLLDVTRDFMGTLQQLRHDYIPADQADSSDFSEKVEQFSNLLSEMAEVLENEDWILLADLLEYEFVPRCGEWNSICQTLHTQVADRAAK